MLDRRLQILIDEGRFQRLSKLARETNLSIAALIREAVDRAFPGGVAEREIGGRQILDAPPMPVPDVAGLRRELDELRGRRG